MFPKTEVIVNICLTPTHFIFLLVILLLYLLYLLLLLSFLLLSSAANETLPFLPQYTALYRGYHHHPVQSHSQTLSLGMRLPPGIITYRYFHELSCENFDKMQIIFKAITESSSHANSWDKKCGHCTGEENLS